MLPMLKTLCYQSTGNHIFAVPFFFSCEDALSRLPITILYPLTWTVLIMFDVKMKTEGF